MEREIRQHAKHRKKNHMSEIMKVQVHCTVGFGCMYNGNEKQPVCSTTVQDRRGNFVYKEMQMVEIIKLP